MKNIFLYPSKLNKQSRKQFKYFEIQQDPSL